MLTRPWLRNFSTSLYHWYSLGVMISHDLKTSNQCMRAYANANKILGMINQELSYYDEIIQIIGSSSHGIYNYLVKDKDRAD